jgi:hypothetical protein
MEKRTGYCMAGRWNNPPCFFVYHLDLPVAFPLMTEKGECFLKFAFQFFP